MTSIARIAAAAALALSATPAFAAGADLVPHRAIYNLSLGSQSQMGDSTAAMTGRMVYEFTGGACEGYTVNFRFVIETTDEDGKSTVTDLRTSNHEDGPGRSFQFLSQTYTNQVLTEDVKGSAERDDTALTVALVSPEPATLALDADAIFPTAHLERIIAAARSGQTVLAQDVYDGSDGGTKIYRTTTIIGAPKQGDGEGAERDLGTITHWPVTVSYFDAEGAGDQTPDYSISFDLWENGVSTDMTMDYGDFALEGSLAGYEALPPAKCE